MRKWAVKACISLVLIFIILSQLDLTEIVQNLKLINVRLYMFAIALGLTDISFRALRWQMLLQVKGINISFAKSLSFLFVGMFFGIFLPTNMGGDIVKMYDFSRYSSKTADTVSSVFMERWTGVISLCLISLSVIFIYQNHVEYKVQILILAVAVLMSVFSIVIFSRRLFEKLLKLVSPQNKLFISLRDKFERLLLSIQDYRKYRMLFVKVLLLGLTINMLRIAINYVNSQSVELNIPFFYFLIFIPVTILIMMIPVTVSGIGLREGVYLYFFSQVGMSASSAVLLSWMGFSVVICQALIGGVIFLFRRNT